MYIFHTVLSTGRSQNTFLHNHADNRSGIFKECDTCDFQYTIKQENWLKLNIERKIEFRNIRIYGRITLM